MAAGVFGLSVAPYAFMSFVNILAMACPEHPAMYLIHTPCMDAAEVDGGHFDGVVADLLVWLEQREKVFYEL